MNIEFIENIKLEKNTVLISKTGHIRFKKESVIKYGMEVGQRYAIGYDKDEIKCQTLYLYSADNNGLKLNCYHGSYSICAKSIMVFLNLPLPLKTTIEPWTYTPNNSVKIKIDGFKLCFEKE